MSDQVTGEAASHHDPRIPARDRCVLRYVLERHARQTPGAVYCVFDDGGEWTYAETLDKTLRFAAGLQALGVRQGDHVLSWLPNGPEALLTFFAVNYLGGVFVPINTAYRGTLLQHVVANSDARFAVVHGDLVARLTEIATHELQCLVTVGESDGAPAALSVRRFAELQGSGEPTPPERPIEPWDTQAIMYTSGTTGPSKGVLMSYLHLFSNAGPESWPFITGDDRFLVNMPIYHIGGMGLPFAMLVRGGSIALWTEFRTEEFWPFVRQTRATAVFLLGVMATFLLKQSATSQDREHCVEKAIMVPLTENSKEIKQRFGIDIYTIFNMTEISSPIVSERNPDAAGTCGKVRPNVQVRLVDDNDCEVPIGAVGEMVVRTDRPWAMTHGYYKNVEATATAWRNGWFHTGDAFRQDDQGNYFFVDRKKDAIRRRGENISSFEVESEVIAHPDVREAAAVGVPSQYSEEDVLVAVAPVEGRSIDPAELLEFLRERMAYFMVPRYIRTLDELPKTPTAKVRKVVLREEGITEDTWDREGAGVQVHRERLGTSRVS